MNKFQVLVLSVVSAILLILAYPQTNWWLLAWVGLVPLFVVINTCSSKSAFRWSFLSAFIFFCGTLGWLSHVTYPGMIILMMYLALYVGCFAWSYKIFTALPVFPRVLARAASWVVLEYLRSYLFTGFGWSLLGHSQYQNLLMIQIADITGVYGVSFLVVLVNLVILETILAMRKKIASHALAMTLAITLILVTASISYGLYQLNKHHDWPTVKIGVVQPNIPQDIKWLPEMRTIIVNKHIQLSNLLKDQQLDLIVWPETSLPGITEDSPDLVNAIRRNAVSLHTPILFGAISQDKANYYNAALIFSELGELGIQYNKIHLVPFGEYLPLRPILGWINNFVPLEDFTSGTAYALFDIGQYKEVAGVLICFEDSLGYLRRNFANHGAKLWINMTNDAWFGDTKAPFMHLQAAVFGSVENKRALVRSANTGFSGFIDPFGRVMRAVTNAQGKQTFVAGVAYADVPLVEKKTFYTKYADLFTFVCFLGILWAIILLIINRRKNMSKKILLVDDDAGVHLVTVPILTKAGYSVISAKTGEQGLQLALNERPDLIILDVIMPGIKGRELCIKLKAYQVLEHIPVVFLTAKDSDDDIQAELDAGAIAHLTKPVNPTELLDKVKGILAS